MPVPPWVIDQMQQERARRDEEDRIRSQRIELPQTGVADDTRRERAAESPTASSVVVVDVSPIADNCIDI